MTAPSAFAAFEIEHGDFLDLDAFPIHDLTSHKRAELVAACRADLTAHGCAHVPAFVTANAVEAMCAEAERLTPLACYNKDRVNPYFTDDDAALPNDHPARHYEDRRSSFINSDHLEADSVLRKFYDSDVVVHFVAECLGGSPIYRWADPLARCPYSVMRDGDYFPWHFDGNDFTVSILVQEAQSGGDFEYAPDIRTPNDECFDAVKKVLIDGERERVRVLKLRTGDLQLFKGRYSMHRVTAVGGDTPRIIALPTYVTNPYLVNRPHHSEVLYGRALPLHYDRDLARVDNLTD